MAITVWRLETTALDDDGSVALALGASLGSGEGEFERRAVRTGPHHRGAGEEAIERRLADLGMELAVVVGLDPGLGGLIEHGERKIGYALQHGHQSCFDNGPEMFELAVHVGAVGQRRLMQYAEPGQTFGDLGRGHRGAVVAHRGARQASLHEGLRQSVGDVFGVLGQIPLQMAGQPGAVVESAEQHGRAPFPARGQHLARANVAIPMDQGSHVLDLVAADLPLGELGLGRQSAGGPPRGHPPSLLQPLRLEISSDCRIGRHRPQGGLVGRQGGQIVPVQLGAPVRVRRVLGVQRLTQRGGHRGLPAGVLAGLAAEHGDRVLSLAPRPIVPSLNSRGAELHRIEGDGVSPFPPRQFVYRGL